MQENLTDKILLSVCIFAYNHEAYIAQAIESVLSQRTNFKFEILVGEDGSIDTTCDILERYKNNNPDKINVIYQDQSKKIYINGNPTGRYNFVNTMQNCKGKYIALLDGDDYWTDPYKLQKQVDFLEANSDYGICFHEIKILKDDKLLDNYITKVPSKVTTVEDLSQGNYIMTCSSIFRNNFVIPEYFKGLNAGDYPLHLLLSQNGEKMYFFEECMGVYRIHKGGIYTSANPLKLSLGNIHLLTTLINNHKNEIVKENLRIQLVNLLNYFKDHLINNLNFSNFIYVFKNIYSHQTRLISMKFLIKWLISKVLNLKNKIKSIRNPKINKITDVKPFVFTNNFKKSYSQCGEDLLVKYVFNLRGISTPSYIDLGANHPYNLSNTALLYESGSRGLNIEANPYLMEAFNVFRHEDINLNLGIGSKNQELDFYMMSDNTLSTFSKEECDNFISTGKFFLKEKRKIKLTTINEILTKYCNDIFPDFLSLDVEGLDFEILNTIDYLNNSPKVICVESADYSPIGAGRKRIEIIEFLNNKGYYEYASTNLNSIMVKNDFWFI